LQHTTAAFDWSCLRDVLRQTGQESA